jgi:hypothetical protein
MECNTCFGVSWTLDSTGAPDGQLEDHLRAHPTHTFRLRRVNDSEPAANVDLNKLVGQHQVWIDNSRARIIALETLVDVLLIGALARGECSVNDVRSIKRGEWPSP